MHAFTHKMVKMTFLLFIQKRSLHKEELNKSETEQQLRHRVSANAPLQQTRSKSVESSTGPSGKTSPQTSPHRVGKQFCFDLADQYIIKYILMDKQATSITG